MATAELEILNLGDRHLVLPRPNTFPTYYPLAERASSMYPGIAESLQDLGREHLLAAFGYGSSFNGESENSLLDFILIVDDPEKFHQENRKRRPKDYDPLVGYWRVQTWFNHVTLNFYPSRFSIDGQIRAIKYGVVGYEDFLRQAKESFGGGAYLYTACRIQKAAIFSFVRNQDKERQIRIDETINQARIDGAWLALGLLPVRFDFEQFALEYIDLSYKADVRAEKPDKARRLLTHSPEDYAAMLGDILKVFVNCGILDEAIGGLYSKRVSPGEEDVRRVLRKAKWFFFGINYFKNPLTFGPIRGLEYGIAKVRRAMAKPLEYQDSSHEGST